MPSLKFCKAMCHFKGMGGIVEFPQRAQIHMACRGEMETLLQVYHIPNQTSF